MKYFIKDNQAGFVLKNGQFKKMITAGTYHFSKMSGYQVEIEEMTGELDYMDVPYQILAKDAGFLASTVHMEIPDGSVGFIYVNGKLTGFAARKEYTFWNVFDKYEIKLVSMEDTEMGQEVLTKDKISIRMNLVCMYKIRDAVEYAETISDLAGQLYPEVQLAIRGITGNYKLDEILEFKDKISGEIYEVLKEKEERYCVTFVSAGIKDIILPGEIREIMNSVLVAEKTAQANVISRREEVASTRSLLNTAKLMDENKTLFKLKELEYLERICDKVGEISVNGSAGIVEQLGRLAGTGKM